MIYYYYLLCIFLVILNSHLHLYEPRLICDMWLNKVYLPYLPTREAKHAGSEIITMQSTLQMEIQ